MNRQPRVGHLMAALVCIALTACVSTPPTQQRAGSVNPDDEPLVNTLRWTTASEVSNFGFDIYRGDTEDGPFTRITASPIPGAGTTDEPQSYVWVDDAIDPSRDYWYYIESISMDSIRERFSPIIRAPAKRPAVDD